MTDSLEGMTYEKWRSLPPKERRALRDLSDLTPQLKGLEGYRVEVEDVYGETRRFIVSVSGGWRPCHIELKRIDSRWGNAADSEYRSVRVVRKVRHVEV